MTAPLPTVSKQIITSLLRSLHSIEPYHGSTVSASGNVNPIPSTLSNLNPSDKEQAKSVLLTLHFLFPHELLPALDLIDRHLITRLWLKKVCGSNEAKAAASKSPMGQEGLEHKESIDGGTAIHEVFYVQSASASLGESKNKGRFRNALSNASQFYEVRLMGWNCSCPAFALSSLRFLMQDLQPDMGMDVASMQREQRELETGHQPVGSEDDDAEWLFGGTVTKEHATVPICKHILAVMLVKAAPALFSSASISKEVDEVEMTGWAAGWGEH